MTIQEIIRALRSLQVETGSLACLGCGHENSCSTKGCSILRQAAEALEQQSVEVEGMRSAANSLKMHLEKATAERDAAVDQSASILVVYRAEGSENVNGNGAARRRRNKHGTSYNENQRRKVCT